MATRVGIRTYPSARTEAQNVSLQREGPNILPLRLRLYTILKMHAKAIRRLQADPEGAGSWGFCFTLILGA